NCVATIRSCIFRCVAFAAHLFLFLHKKKNATSSMRLGTKRKPTFSGGFFVVKKEDICYSVKDVCHLGDFLYE
ncbi:MAG: hypothetical protein IKJ44_05685, partial [Elusimicrobiaceae bacterium]|nr:hypothetical protein [Elusimicrobiaceae bacterium]